MRSQPGGGQGYGRMVANWRKSLRLAHNARIPVASLEQVEKWKPGTEPAKESAAQSTDRKSKTDGAEAKLKRGASNRSGGNKGAEEDGEEGRREMTIPPSERPNLILAEFATHNSTEA